MYLEIAKILEGEYACTITHEVTIKNRLVVDS